MEYILFVFTTSLATVVAPTGLATSEVLPSARSGSSLTWDHPRLASGSNALAVGTVAPTCRGQGFYFKPKRLVMIGGTPIETSRFCP